MLRIFKVSIPGSTVALLLSEALVILACYFVATYATLVSLANIYLVDEGGWWRIVIVGATILLGLYFLDLYENHRIPSRTALVQQFSLILGVALLLQALLSYGHSVIALGPRIMAIGSLLVLIFGPLWRVLFTDVVWKAVGAQKLLFVGSSPSVLEIAQELKGRPELGMRAMGFLSSGESVPDADGFERLGAVTDLAGAVAQYRPDRIVIGMAERRGSLPMKDLLDLRFSGVTIEDYVTTYETIFHRVPTRGLRPSQLIFSADLGPHENMMALQSIYSWVFGVVLLVLTLPLTLLVAIAVKLSSRGPILYKQTRVGKNGHPFVLYKFRSMHADAEAGTGAVWAAKDDPRVTPLGHWLRKLRFDELPQLVNVVRGEMSLVGPRPERPEFVKPLQEEILYYRHRLSVKPGITGWAQINYKYGDTIEDAIAKLEYDLYYIKNLAPSLDAFIIFHTIKTVLFGRGAQ